MQTAKRCRDSTGRRPARLNYPSRADAAAHAPTLRLQRAASDRPTLRILADCIALFITTPQPPHPSTRPAHCRRCRLSTLYSHFPSLSRSLSIWFGLRGPPGQLQPMRTSCGRSIQTRSLARVVLAIVFVVDVLPLYLILRPGLKSFPALFVMTCIEICDILSGLVETLSVFSVVIIQIYYTMHACRSVMTFVRRKYKHLSTLTKCESLSHGCRQQGLV